MNFPTARGIQEILSAQEQDALTSGLQILAPASHPERFHWLQTFVKTKETHCLPTYFLVNKGGADRVCIPLPDNIPTDSIFFRPHTLPARSDQNMSLRTCRKSARRWTI